jgi:PhzF family phenazine biosynthesis protein
MAVSYFGVDAFSAVPFGGNPAVVCLLDAHAESGTEPDEGWMRRVGAEFNQPATAFLWRDARGYRLRWFTASTELPLCGHGTLAAAHVLYETDRAGADQALTFQTGAGAVTATCRGHRIWLELPGAALTEASPPEAVLSAAGVSGPDVVWVGRNDFEYVVRLADPSQVRAARPDFAALLALPETRVCLTAAGGVSGAPPADFTSRVFAPALGVDEDQVTGSAHAVLGQLWAGWLGRTELAAWQASARGGQLSLIVGADSVRVGGQALITRRGELLV